MDSLLNEANNIYDPIMPVESSGDRAGLRKDDSVLRDIDRLDEVGEENLYVPRKKRMA